MNLESEDVGASMNLPESFGLDRGVNLIERVQAALGPAESLELLLQAWVKAVRIECPDWAVHVQLVGATGPESDGGGDLTTLRAGYAEGNLRHDRRGLFWISRDQESDIPTSDVATYGLTLTDDFASPFDGPQRWGRDFVLSASSGFLGVVHVATPTPWDICWTAPVRVAARMLAKEVELRQKNRDVGFFRHYLVEVLEHINAPVILLNDAKAIVAANRSFVETIGAERNDLVGRVVYDVLPESEVSSVREVLESSFADQITRDIEVTIPRAIGGDARVAFTVLPIADVRGSVVAVAALGRDLTEVRNLEQQIIHADRLVTVGQFAASIVHELNNPLTNIAVYADFLLQKHKARGGDPGDQQKLERIVSSAERIQRFTHDLIAYARPSSEESTLLNLSQVLVESAGFCEHLLTESGVALQWNLSDEPVLVRGVRGQLHQAFINLITNACQAMLPREPEAGVRGIINIGLEEENEFVRVVIADNGPGIPDGLMSRIFEPFFSTKHTSGGTGLGLSIVGRIANQHQGSVRVRSGFSPERGAGAPAETVFELLVPKAHD